MAHSQRIKVYADAFITFGYPTGCCARRTRNEPPRQYTIGNRHTAGGIIEICDEGTAFLAEQALSMPLFSIGEYQCCVLREGSVQFAVATGRERLVSERHWRTGKVLGDEWDLRLTLGSDVQVYVHVKSVSRPIDQSLWTECLDALAPGTR